MASAKKSQKKIDSLEPVIASLKEAQIKQGTEIDILLKDKEKQESRQEEKNKRIESQIEKLEKSIRSRIYLVLAVLTVIISLVGAIGYTNLVNTVRDKILEEGIIAKKNEYRKAISTIQDFTKDGENISKNYLSDTVIYKEKFASWKIKVIDFLRFSHWAKSEYIISIHEKHLDAGNDYKKSIDDTNNALEIISSTLNDQLILLK